MTRISQIVATPRLAFLAGLLAVFAMAGTPAQAERLDLPGKSYGGKVRAGPGLNHRQTGSTYLNDRIVLIERAGRMDSYDWFLIRLPNGKTGYQWGGLMCADGEETGILTICGSPMDRELSGEPAPASTARASDAPESDVEYSCNEGIPLHVRFRNEGPDFVAYASHDSYPKVRMPQIPSASGNQFEAGPNWLATKGDEALINFDGIEDRCVRVQ